VYERNVLLIYSKLGWSNCQLNERLLKEIPIHMKKNLKENLPSKFGKSGGLL
jgi:hypothetical protein